MTAATADTGTILLQHSEAGAAHRIPVFSFQNATLSGLVDHLRQRGKLPPDDPKRPLYCVCNGRTVSMADTFSAQQIGDGAVLTLATRGRAAC